MKQFRPEEIQGYTQRETMPYDFGVMVQQNFIQGIYVELFICTKQIDCQNIAQKFLNLTKLCIRSNCKVWLDNVMSIICISIQNL